MFNFPKDATAALIESTELVMKLQDENARLREELDCTKDILEQTRVELAILRAASAVLHSRGGV